jgi:hypothetical protein
MSFFEFESEFLESARSVAEGSSSTGGPQGRSAGAGSAATPRSPSSPRGSGSGRAGAPTARPAASGRPQQPAAAAPIAAPQGARDGRTSPPASSASGARPSGGSGGFSFDRFMPYVTQGFDFAGRGAQIAQQFAAFPGAGGQPPGDAGQPAGYDGRAVAQPSGLPGFSPQPSGYDVGAVPQPYGPGAVGQPAPSVDQLGILLQALRDRQIPSLPGLPSQPPPAVTPAASMAPQTDAMTLLRLILGNPQFQQALQWSAVMGAAGPRAVELPVPATSAPRRMRSVPIPLGAVMNAISALAGQSMTELNANTREDDPEVPAYLVDEEGEFIVDPAIPHDRAALVAHLFRVSEQAERAGRFRPPDSLPREAADELDESDEWAREAGFTV